MNFLGFGQSAEIDIVFDGAESRKTAEVKGEDGKLENMLLYYDGETVSGKVGTKFECYASYQTIHKYMGISSITIDDRRRVIYVQVVVIHVASFFNLIKISLHISVTPCVMNDF